MTHLPLDDPSRSHANRTRSDRLQEIQVGVWNHACGGMRRHRGRLGSALVERRAVQHLDVRNPFVDNVKDQKAVPTWIIEIHVAMPG